MQHSPPQKKSTVTHSHIHESCSLISGPYMSLRLETWETWIRILNLAAPSLSELGKEPAPLACSCQGKIPNEGWPWLVPFSCEKMQRCFRFCRHLIYLLLRRQQEGCQRQGTGHLGLLWGENIWEECLASLQNQGSSKPDLGSGGIPSWSSRGQVAWVRWWAPCPRR